MKFLSKSTKPTLSVPEYDVIHPVQVDYHGNFLSRDLANGNTRRKRDAGSTTKEGLFFKFSAFGRDYHLNVTLNDKLLSPNFVVEVRGNGTSRFQYDIEHCHYIGQLVSVKGHASKVAISNCDGLVRSTDFSMYLIDSDCYAVWL